MEKEKDLLKEERFDQNWPIDYHKLLEEEVEANNSEVHNNIIGTSSQHKVPSGSE